MSEAPAARLGSPAPPVLPTAEHHRRVAAASGVAPDLLRSVLRHHAKGVAVITAGADQPVGLCATSLTSVSLDPPVVLFAIGVRSSSWPVISAARYVLAHLLAEHQHELARTFGRPGADRFGPDTRWHRGPLGLPVLDDVLAWMVLAPAHTMPVGDHAVVLGRVVMASHVRPGDPLVHHKGRFVRLAELPDADPAAVRR